jgi:hypothetical protein
MLLQLQNLNWQLQSIKKVTRNNIKRSTFIGTDVDENVETFVE